MESSRFNVQQSVVVDSRSLDALRTQADKDPKAALRAAAKQFETVFMSMVLKSMRDTVPKDGLMSGGSEEQMFQGMLDQQFAQGMADGKSGGLADLIVKQLSRNLNIDQSADAKIDTGALRAATRAVQNEQSRTSHPVSVASPTVASGTATVATAGESPRAFVERMWGDAKAAEARVGVPAEFMLGQAALESGWGKREVIGVDGTASHNLFGIKATGGWTGKTVDAMTTEYVNGVAVKKVERFRAYDSYADSFADYAQLIGDKPRYASVLQQTSAQGFANGLQNAGYATDPRYAEKLTRVINQTIALSRTA